MEINSTFNTGVQGYQKASQAADEAAANIVANTSVDEQETLATADSEKVTGEENSIPNLNQSIVDLKVAEFQAKASTEVIKTADDNLGTLLDVTA